MKKSIMIAWLLIIVLVVINSANAEGTKNSKANVSVKTLVSQLDALDAEASRLYVVIISNKDILAPEMKLAFAGFPQQIKNIRTGMKSLKEQVLSPIFDGVMPANDRDKFLKNISLYIVEMRDALKEMRESIEESLPATRKRVI